MIEATLTPSKTFKNTVLLVFLLGSDGLVMRLRPIVASLALALAALNAGGWFDWAAKSSAQETSLQQPPTFETPAAVKAAFEPLAKTISDAKSLRATVKLTVTSAVGDEVLGKNEGLLQLASITPNKLALAAKFDSDAIRFACNGEKLFIQLSPTAYVESEPPKDFQSLIAAMPIQLGPQPEPMLWLCLAGLNPLDSMLQGLSSAEVVDNAGPDAKNTIIRASRPEGIRWELTLSQEAKPRPVSLAIDITDMITQANNMQLPAGYSFKIHYNFERWEVDTELSKELFQFNPPKDAERFESMSEFLLKKNNSAPHPLLGKPAPVFTTKTPAGDEVKVLYDSEEVLVLDFWATWCAPCVESLPEMSQLAESYKDRGVRFFAINVSEEIPAIESFLKERKLSLPVLLDPQGEIAGAFSASAIPLTVLIGKSGRVEAVHVGFDPQESAEILAGEIDTLLAGRRIYEAKEIEEQATEEQATEEQAPEEKAREEKKS